MQFNPMKPLAGQIMNHTMNPHNEGYHNPVTGRDTIGQPIRDGVYERGTIGQPLEGRVTGRTSTGHPISTHVSDITRVPTYGADNLGIGNQARFTQDCIDDMRKKEKEERERKDMEFRIESHSLSGSSSRVSKFAELGIPDSNSSPSEFRDWYKKLGI